MTPHQRAAQRLYDGTTTLLRQAAQWAATHKRAAAISAALTAPAAPHLLNAPGTLYTATAAAWCWAAWNTTPPATPTAPTSDNKTEEGLPPGGGAGMSIIKTVNGTATTHPHPTQPNRTLITWENQDTL